MSDGMAFSCILKLLNDKQNYVSQTKADQASSAYLVMKLTKKYAVSINLNNRVIFSAFFNTCYEWAVVNLDDHDHDQLKINIFIEIY